MLLLNLSSYQLNWELEVLGLGLGSNIEWLCVLLSAHPSLLSTLAIKLGRLGR